MGLIKNLVPPLITLQLIPELIPDVILQLKVLTNLKLHLAAFQAGLPTSVLFNLDGSNFIIDWFGITGTSINANQSSEPNRALLGTAESIFGGRPIVDIAGNVFMDLSSQPVTGTAARTLIFVVRSTVQAASNPIMTLNDNFGADGSEYKITSEIGVRVRVGNKLYANDDISTGSILTFQNAASSNIQDMSVFKNGTLLISTSGAFNPAINTGADTAQIGTHAGDFFDGQIGEIIVYDRVLTTDELNEIHGDYLGPKWGVTVAQI